MDGALLNRLQRCPALPSLPAVALALIEIGRKPEPGLCEVAATIGRDPALTAKLLRVANSPLYAQRRKVENLQRALMVLGMNAALSLSLSFTLVGALGACAGGALEHAEYWRRSLIVGTAARAFGARARCGERETLFLAGLLQDIGMLALNAAVPERYAAVLAWGTHDHHALALGEHAEFDADHAVVGAWLLEQWRLSGVFVDAVRHSHAGGPADLELLPAPQRGFCAAMAVAGAAAALWCLPPRADTAQVVADRAQRLLGLEPDAVVEALEEVEQTLPQIAELLEVELGDPVLLRGLSDLARETLIVRNLRVADQALARRPGPVRGQDSDGPTGSEWQDGLTGVSNRTWLDRLLPDEMAAARVGGWPLSLVLLDLTGFAGVNVAVGHAAGDAVLIEIATRLLGLLRQGDGCVRYGGAAFLMVLPGADAAAATAIAARLGEAVALPVRIGMAGSGAVVNLTTLAGIATYEPGELPAYDNTDVLLAAVERALARTKAASRGTPAAIEAPLRTEAAQ